MMVFSTAAVLGGALYLPLRLHAAPDPWPRHALPPAQAGGTVVGLCDGKTLIEVPGLRPGRAVSAALMAKCRRQHALAEWQMAQAQSNPAQGLTPREQMIADTETEKFVAEGKAIFHSADKLGGTVGICCDMCHPDTANTHPETYPKYQVQLQRVALLRDMINWCIENPVKGKPLSPDDPKLRGLEAYIIAQRNGVPLAYGKY
jgi:hypothetical protein